MAKGQRPMINTDRRRQNKAKSKKEFDRFAGWVLYFQLT